MTVAAVTMNFCLYNSVMFSCNHMSRICYSRAAINCAVHESKLQYSNTLIITQAAELSPS